MSDSELSVVAEAELWIASVSKEREGLWLKINSLRYEYDKLLVEVSSSRSGLDLLIGFCQGKGFIVKIFAQSNISESDINASVSVRRKYQDESSSSMGSVYCITNMITGRKYVGSTTHTVARRWKSHVSHAKYSDPHSELSWAILANGPKSFKVETLEVVSYSKLREREEYWIERLGSFSPHGYNKARAKNI